MNTEQVREEVKRRRFWRRAITIAVTTVATVYIILSTLYFVLPDSKVKAVNIRGQHYYRNSDISHLIFDRHLPSGGAYLPTFDEQRYIALIANTAKNSLESLVSDVAVDVRMFALNIDYRDILPVYSYQQKIYLSSGQVMPGSSLPSFRYTFDEDDYGSIDSYVANLPQFIVAPTLSFDSHHDAVCFSGAEPLSLRRFSYIYKLSDNVYYLYEHSAVLSAKNNTDIYIRYRIAGDVIGEYLTESRISVISRAVESLNSREIVADDSVGKNLKIINYDISTNGDK